MSKVIASTFRTHHVTLPLCASSFIDHAGCQGTIRTMSSILKCDCVPCHGEEATPEAVCEECRASMPLVIHENAIAVGERIAISRSASRYCNSCRAEMLQDLADARAVRR